MTDEGYEVMGPAHGPLAPSPIGPPMMVTGQKPTVAPPTAPPLAVTLEKKHVMEKAAAKKNNRDESESESTAEATAKGKSSMRSVITEPGEESRMESSEMLDGTAIVQRPTSLDICQLATAILMTIIVLVIAIPVILAASGKADIEYITKKLQKL